MRFNPTALRIIRERSGMSITDLAHAAGIDRTALGRIERGERPGTAAQIVAAARALDVPVPAISSSAEEAVA